MNATKIEKAQSQTAQPRHGATKIKEAQSPQTAQISSDFENDYLMYFMSYTKLAILAITSSNKISKHIVWSMYHVNVPCQCRILQHRVKSWNCYHMVSSNLSEWKRKIIVRYNTRRYNHSIIWYTIYALIDDLIKSFLLCRLVPS